MTSELHQHAGLGFPDSLFDGFREAHKPGFALASALQPDAERARGDPYAGASDLARHARAQ